jgi:hypothetical protein
MALSHNTLANYYMINFSLMQHHKYSLTEIESMMPWEREIYLKLLVDHIETERKKKESN